LESPLKVACGSQQVEVAALLLRHGADPNEFSGQSALSESLRRFGRHPLTRRLLRMTTVECPLGLRCIMSAVKDLSLLEEVLASRLDFGKLDPCRAFYDGSTGIDPQDQKKLDLIFKKYKEDPEATRRSSNQAGAKLNGWYLDCFSFSRIFSHSFLASWLSIAQETAEIFCIVVFCCDEVLKPAPAERHKRKRVIWRKSEEVRVGKQPSGS